MHRSWLVALCWLVLGRANAQQSDSLRGALEVVSRRHRDISDAVAAGSPYYIDRSPSGLGPRYHTVRPDQEELSYYDSRDGFQDDGQPEDIGYGYQKSIAPHTAGIFEPVPLPSSELGAHDTLANSHLPRITEKELEELAADYLGNDIDNNHLIYKYPRNRFPSSSKRSIFRERGEGVSPEALQHLYLANQESGPLSPDFDSGRQVLVPSSFRERYPGRPGLPQNALALIRSFGGLDRDQEIGPDGDVDSDEYLTMLNSIWEKYKGKAPDSFDPEDVSESDVEQLIDFLGEKEDRKRQDHWGGGYDFFNSPMTWNKRSKQKLDSPQNDGFFHALKFLSTDRDVLESMRDEDLPTDDSDEDVARLLMEQAPGRLSSQGAGLRASPGRMYRKRMWRDIGGFDDRFPPYKRVAKRFPVTKRSPSFFSSPSNNKSSTNLAELVPTKANNGVNADATDPKVAQELNNIFSTSGAGEKEQSNETESKEKDKKAVNKTKSVGQEKIGEEEKEEEEKEHPPHAMHRRDKETAQGQKEETGTASGTNRPLDVKKKSVDWSDYFGIDRRRKKSLNNNFNDEWLLNQYLNTYSISNKHPSELSQLAGPQQYEGLGNVMPDFELQKKVPDDIDGKLRAMEDLIVEEALKYTGAHEGMTDSKEVQKVKDRVMSQLAAAYSLEKMRRALGEFKSSIASRKENAVSSDISTPKPVQETKEDQKSKRVAVKKEKAEIEYKDKKMEKKSPEESEFKYPPVAKPLHSVPNTNYIQQAQEEEMCPELGDIAGRCRQISIIAGDRGDLFLPLCTLHQICYLCGPELGTATPGGCDVSFLNEANAVCQDSSSCRFVARRILGAMRSLKGDPSPESCDWRNNPCLARFLALATDR